MFKYKKSVVKPRKCCGIERYSIMCPSCNGYGYVPQTLGMSSSATRVCPACKGSKVIEVVREIKND